ncbi:MAG: fibronectin type III domain-containing protein [Bacteroidota bacterium]
MKHYFLFIIFFLICGFNQIIAQSVFIKACVADKKVILRWAPKDFKVWELGNKYGYKIERLNLSEEVVPDTGKFKIAERLNSNSILPLTPNDSIWVDLIRENKTAILIYKSLYDKSNLTTNKTEIEQGKDQMLGMVLVSCDLNANFSKAAGLYFKDTTFNNGAIYAYKITTLCPNKLGKYSAVCLVNTNKKTVFMTPVLAKGKGNNRQSMITWNFKNLQSDYSGYNIERSEDSINFARINKSPYVVVTTQFEKNKTETNYLDSLPKNKKNYYYRIKGISLFGEEGLPSNIIKVRGKDDFKQAAQIDSAFAINNKIIKIKWQMDKKVDSKTLKGYLIIRSDNSDGKYQSILKGFINPDKNYFIDSLPNYINYYKIIAVNDENDSTFSYPALAQIIDDVPPAIPVELKGIVNDSGKVTLNWLANTEKDLRGYRVFRSNALHEEFVEVTKELLNTTNYSEKINTNTLTKDIFYTIAAVDKNYNNSNQCPPFKLKRPDHIPPVAPMIKKFDFTDSSIVINWIPSSSFDATNYKLVRYNDKKDSVIVKEWNAKDSLSKYNDYLVELGSGYYYKLKVTDDVGNKNESKALYAKIEPGFRKKPTNFNAKLDIENKKILLKWGYEIKEPILYFTIYKSKNNSEFRIFKTIDKNQFEIFDKEININNIYRYQLKVVLESGIESLLSSEVVVPY